MKKKQTSGWLPFFFCLSALLHMIWFIVFFYIVCFGHDALRIEAMQAPEVIAFFAKNKDLVPYADSISYASALGRLDIIALILAVLGVALVVTAVPVFSLIKNSAIQQAKDAGEEAIREYLKENGTQLIAGILQKDKLIAKALREDTQLLYMINDIADNKADQIAVAMPNGEDENAGSH